MVFGGCYIPLMAYCAVEEVETGMRRSTIKVNTLCTVPVTRALLSTKYIKGLWENRTGAFSSLCCGACNTAVNHSLFRVWVVSLQPIIAGEILAMAVDALKG